MQASGTEIINWGRTYMHTPDKYTEKKKSSSTIQHKREHAQAKSTRSFLKGWIFFFLHFYFLAKDIREVYINVM